MLAAAAVEQKMEITVVTVVSAAAAKAVKQPLRGVAVLKVGLPMVQLTQVEVEGEVLEVQRPITMRAQEDQALLL